MVEINFMVDTEGKPFEPVVTHSMGGSAFEEAALKALLRKGKFEPATLNGEPIVGSSTYRFTFKMTEAEGASRSFIRRYRRFSEALETGDKEQIDSALNELETQGSMNFYEDSYLNLARYNHAHLYGSEAEQMEFLHGALSYIDSEDDYLYFSDETGRDLLRMLLPLQLKTSHFAEAMDTYAIMEANGDSEGLASVEPVMETIRALEFDETAYALPIILNEQGSQQVKLYKHQMYFSEGDGDLDEASLRCDQKYIAFSIERDISYDIPAEWGRCTMQVLGDPSAHFDLVQH